MVTSYARVSRSHESCALACPRVFRCNCREPGYCLREGTSTGGPEPKMLPGSSRRINLAVGEDQASGTKRLMAVAQPCSAITGATDVRKLVSIHVASRSSGSFDVESDTRWASGSSTGTGVATPAIPAAGPRVMARIFMGIVF